ncbi:hypothetical protein VTN02DRAFT_6663 [Thermoascus thermophilus]
MEPTTAAAEASGRPGRMSDNLEAEETRSVPYARVLMVLSARVTPMRPFRSAARNDG